MKFQKAERKKAKLRLAFSGPSGSGKTYSSLLVAKGIGGRIAVIDTEHNSADLYAGKPEMPEFDSLALHPPYTPERFIEALQAAEAEGYNVLIIDSITHEWSGSGGCLEINDNIARAKYKGNTWSAWNETTPRHRAFMDAILRSPLHIIATMRSKTETTQTEENGRKRVVKLGMKAEQRDGVEYEFTTVLDLVHDGHYAIASKDRTGLFAGDPRPITEDTGKQLLAWLESGIEAPSPAAAIAVDQDTINKIAGLVADFRLSFSECETLPQLADQFAKAQKAVKEHKDAVPAENVKAFLYELTKAKDVRKDAIQKAKPTTQPAEPAHGAQ